MRSRIPVGWVVFGVGALAWAFLLGFIVSRLIMLEPGPNQPVGDPTVAVMVITATPRFPTIPPVTPSPTPEPSLTPDPTATSVPSATGFPTIVIPPLITASATGEAPPPTTYTIAIAPTVTVTLAPSATTESGTPITPLPEFVLAAPTLPPSITPEPSQTPIYVIVTSAPTDTPNPCPPPDGWVAYRVEDGDTLFGFQLGTQNQVDVQTLMKANCLSSKLIFEGQVIYLPPGAADKAPKIDVAAPAPISGPRGPANCPCTITVRAGHRREQIAAQIDSLPVAFSGAEFLAVTAGNVSVGDRWFLAGKPGAVALEGFMFPGTYTVENSTTAAGFRDMLLDAFGANVSAQMGSDVAAHGMTFWQAIVLASIVQRESGAASEQALIASTFHNRLRSGMSLGTYVTLQYALGVPGNWWPRLNSSNTRIKTPYDTLGTKGLPPSPIASPGMSAIQAAVYPPQTNYLYFSAKCGGGGNFYAATYEEFKKGLDCGRN